MYRVGILIISDKGSTGREDRSGQQIQDLLGQGYQLEYYEVIPDEKEEIVKRLIHACDVLSSTCCCTPGHWIFQS